MEDKFTTLNARLNILQNQTQILINQTVEKRNEVCIIDDSDEEICLTSDEIKMVKEILASGEVNVKEKQKKFLGLF